MATSNSTARLATHLSWFTTVAIVLFLAAGVVMLLYPGLLSEAVPAGLKGVRWQDTALWQRIATQAVMSVPLILLVYGFWHVRRFFNLYREGNLFPAQAGFHVKRFGQVLVAVAIAQIIAGALASVLLSAHMPEGQKTLAVGLSSTNLATVLIAFLVMLIGRVLDEACTVAEENRSII
ncbi:MAG: hypothetical protein WBD37_06345 [Anderseniella sp.]